MSDAFYLSDDEVVVLLGLCHGTVAYGIESKLFSHWQRQDQQMVKDLMNRLQSRDLISLDYHGVVHIKKGLYDLLQVMKAPTELLSLKTVLFSGEK